MLDSRYYEEEEFEEFSSYDIENNEFVECVFKSLDLNGANFNNARFIECRFEKCNLSNISVTNCSFRDVTFNDCKVIGVNWSSLRNISDFSMKNSNLDYSVFQNLSLNFSNFEGSSLKEVDLSECQLQNSNFKGCNLLGTSFTNSNLFEADIRGAVQYYIEPEFTQIKKAKFSMPEAMSLLKAIGVEVE